MPPIGLSKRASKIAFRALGAQHCTESHTSAYVQLAAARYTEECAYSHLSKDMSDFSLDHFRYCECAQ